MYIGIPKVSDTKKYSGTGISIYFFVVYLSPLNPFKIFICTYIFVCKINLNQNDLTNSTFMCDN